jgi:hypothetical protein
METLNFEALKLTLKQNASGYVLQLRIHPNELPEALFRDYVGSRYMVAMVRVNEDETPVLYSHSRSTRAAMLCKNEQFQTYLLEHGYTTERNEKAATNAVYEICGIDSRSELNAQVPAQKAFDNLVESYEEYAKDEFI